MTSIPTKSYVRRRWWNDEGASTTRGRTNGYSYTGIKSILLQAQLSIKPLQRQFRSVGTRLTVNCFSELAARLLARTVNVEKRRCKWNWNANEHEVENDLYRASAQKRMHRLETLISSYQSIQTVRSGSLQLYQLTVEIDNCCYWFYFNVWFSHSMFHQLMNAGDEKPALGIRELRRITRNRVIFPIVPFHLPTNQELILVLIRQKAFVD